MEGETDLREGMRKSIKELRKGDTIERMSPDRIRAEEAGRDQERDITAREEADPTLEREGQDMIELRESCRSAQDL